MAREKKQALRVAIRKTNNHILTLSAHFFPFPYVITHRRTYCRWLPYRNGREIRILDLADLTVGPHRFVLRIKGSYMSGGNICDNDHGTVTLLSSNPEIGAMIYAKHEIKIQGISLGLIRLDLEE